MSKEETAEHKAFLKEERKKSKEQEKARSKNKKTKHVISPVLG